MVEPQEEKINLKKLLDSIPFVDLRHLPVYSNTNILFQQIIKCLLGYNDQSDQKILINDPLLSLKSLICSQATVSRFYDRVSLNTTNEFKKIITQLTCDFVNTNIDDPILDADSTMVTTCGNQEASAYIHHYQESGYHPLVINEYHSKLLLSSLLRTGSAYSYLRLPFLAIARIARLKKSDIIKRSKASDQSAFN